MARALTIWQICWLVIAFQRIPAFHLGRPAGALLGTVAIVAYGVLDFDATLTALDRDTILTLLGMMVILGQPESSGFFEAAARAILRRASSARGLLWWVVFSAGALSAVFTNDTICLRLTPFLVRAARRPNLVPVPLLSALAAAASLVPLLPFVATLAPLSIIGLVLFGILLSWRHLREFS